MDSPNRSSRPARRPRTRLDTRPAAPESAPTIHYGAAAARLLDRRSAAPNGGYGALSAPRACNHTPNTMGNFCFDVTLSYRRLERPRRVTDGCDMSGSTFMSWLVFGLVLMLASTRGG